MQGKPFVVAAVGALLAGALALAGAAPAPAQLLPGPPGGEVAAAGAAAAPVLVPGAPADATTAVHGDATRRGWVAGSGLAPPYGVLWRATLGDDPGPPLVAAGRVFGHATAAGLDTATVSARDAATGEELWRVPITANGSELALAYASGRLVALDASRRLHALDPETGYEDWQVLTAAGRGATPVLAGDRVIVQGGGSVEAYGLVRGARLWSRALPGAGAGDPAVVGDRVYVATGCALTALDARDGRTLWSVPGPCRGGSAGRAMAFGTLVTSPDAGDGRLHDAATGAVVAAAGPLPRVVTTSTAFTLGDTTLEAIDLADAGRRWTVAARPGAPLPATLLGLGTGLLGVRDGAIALRHGATGAVRWAAQLRRQGGAGADAEGDAAPGAGGGILVVPFGRQLVALAPVARARPDRISLRASRRRDRLAGDPLPLSVATGRQFVRRVVLEADVFPLRRGPFRVLRTLSADAADERLRLRPRALGNVRLRVRPLDGGAPSRTVTYFVYPKLRYTVTQSRGRVVVPLRARGRGVGGLRVAMYLLRPRGRSGRRLDMVRLARTSATGGRATLRFAALRGVRPEDTLVACVVGAERHGLGRRDFLQARCGRRSFRY